MRKKVISVVGARPNFMKVAPIHRAFKDKEDKFEHLICHTGQHYDEKMSKIFFTDLGLPEPDYYLGIGGGTHAEQTGKIMIEFEKILNKEKPDLVLVVGDVNSTIACGLTASKLHIKLAHVEAGLRSFDRKMPEEINRILTDTISDYMFVSEPSGLKNLKDEGVPEDKVHYVGNVMIDSLVHFLSMSGKSEVGKDFGLEDNNYVLVTLHRPANVDDPEKLEELFGILHRVSQKRKVIFPIHPRTYKNLDKFDYKKLTGNNFILTDPVGYTDFISLIKNAELVLTDSGGIQEETTYLGVQCITLRDTTERPVTVNVGTNFLLGNDLKAAEAKAMDILEGNKKEGRVPELWDGHTAERIVAILEEKIAG